MTKVGHIDFPLPGFTIEQVRAHWDMVAHLYDHVNEKIGYAHQQRFIHGIAYFQCGQSPRILNIWSRTGQAIPYLRQRFPKGHFVHREASAAMITLSKQHFPEEDFRQTDLTDLKLDSESFDVILSLETLEHCPDPYRFICELFRVLKQGGEVVLSCPSPTAEPMLRLYEMCFENHGEGPHKFPWSWHVKKMLRSAGFSLLEHRGTGFLPIIPNRFSCLDYFLSRTLGRTPIAELGIRQFYYCTKPAMSGST